MENNKQNKNISSMLDEQIRGYKTSFLPATEPALIVADGWQSLTEIATHLPEIIEQKELLQCVGNLTIPDVGGLSPDQYGGVKLLLGIISQAYIWHPVHDQVGASPLAVLPAVLAKPLVQVSALLHEAPIFNYADYVLRNWRRKDDQAAITVDNLKTLVAFSDTDSEVAFVVVHVAYEAVAGEAIRLSHELLQAVDGEDVDQVSEALKSMTRVLEQLHHVFLQVKDIVSPEVFRYKIRMFLKGWKNITPMTYEDTFVDANSLRGETGAVSSVLPYFDALLGIFSGYEERANLAYIPRSERRVAVAEYQDFRHYMPVQARQQIIHLEQQSSLRLFVQQHSSHSALVTAYDDAVDTLVSMRSAHGTTITPYIGSKDNNKDYLSYGTGGSDYRVYLGVLRDITRSAKIQS